MPPKGIPYYVGKATYERGVYTTYGATREQASKNNNAISVEVIERYMDPDAPVVVLSTGSSGLNSTHYGLVHVGTPYDSRCTPLNYSYYTVPEALPQAKLWWEGKLAGMRARANSYYSQPWV